MIRRVRAPWLLVVLTVLVTLPAAGTTVAGATVDEPVAGDTVAAPCDDVAGDSVVAFFGDDTAEDGSVTVYEGTRADVVFCTGGTPEPVGTEWLPDDADGFEAVDESPWAVAADDGYHVRITGSVAFDEVVSAADAGVTVDVTSSTGTGLADHPIVDDSSINPEDVEAYADARGEVRAASEELRRSAERLAGADGVNVSDLENTRGQVERLQQENETMVETKQNITSEIDPGGADAPRTVAFLQQIEREERRTSENASSAVDSYRQAIEDDRSSATSSVRMAFGLPLVGGAIAGAAVGAAIPVVAARRVEDSMRFSRDVSYDRKVALVPIGVGVVLTLVGVALLIALGATDLLGVLL